jgi:hypothetical protein
LTNNWGYLAVVSEPKEARRKSNARYADTEAIHSTERGHEKNRPEQGHSIPIRGHGNLSVLLLDWGSRCRMG